MFSRDLKDTRYHTPRTLQESRFGPYARLSVQKTKSGLSAAFWMAFYGCAIGAFWYACYLARCAE